MCVIESYLDVCIVCYGAVCSNSWPVQMPVIRKTVLEHGMGSDGSEPRPHLSPLWGHICHLVQMGRIHGSDHLLFRMGIPMISFLFLCCYVLLTPLLINTVFYFLTGNIFEFTYLFYVYLKVLLLESNHILLICSWIRACLI